MYAAILAAMLAFGGAGGIRARDNADHDAADIEGVADAAVAELADPGFAAAVNGNQRQAPPRTRWRDSPGRGSGLVGVSNVGT